MHTTHRTRRRKQLAPAGVGIGAAALLALVAQPTATAEEPDTPMAYAGAYAWVLPDEGAPSGRLLDAGELPGAQPAGPTAAQETYELTEQGIGDDGQPLTPGEEWTTYAIDLDTVTTYGPDDRLPAGDYAVVSVVDDHILQIHTLLDLHEDTTVTFDTREATPVDLSVFDPEAEPTMTSAGFLAIGEDGFGIGVTYFTRGPEVTTFRTQHTGPTQPTERLRTAVGASWAVPGEDTRYHAGYAGSGDEMLNAFSHRVAEDELARVDLRVGSPTDEAGGLLALRSLAHTSYEEITRPATTRHYVTGGEWYTTLHEVPDPDGEGTLTFSDDSARSYEAGRTYEHSINVGPFAPTANASWFYRQGDELLVRTMLLADSDGFDAGSVQYEGSTTLTRDGEVLQALDAPLYRHQFALPRDEEPASYELTTTFRRNAPLSSEVTLSFAFDSATPPGDQTQELLSMVEFSPKLALDSTAPAGKRMAVPVTVHGAAAGENLASLAVDVSYDGGETWRKAAPTRQRTAVWVNNPAAGESVSLRATATDRDGNATTVTVIDAYRTR